VVRPAKIVRFSRVADFFSASGGELVAPQVMASRILASEAESRKRTLSPSRSMPSLAQVAGRSTGCGWSFISS